MTELEPILVYYFAFPHYRKAILQELQRTHGEHLTLMSGESSRGGIAVITTEQLPGLVGLSTRKIGPLTWDRGAAPRAIGVRSGAVILGPALSSLSTWATLLARRLLGRRTYLWGQCGRPGDRSIRRWAQEVMNRLASGLLVYGEAEALAAKELGTKPRKVYVINNASDFNGAHLSSEATAAVLSQLESRTSEAVKRGEVRLVYIGRINWSKRPEVLLDAARLLKNVYANLRVDVIGGGDVVEELRASYPDVEFNFHGWLYAGAERDRIIRRASLIVSPFHMGLLAIDALRFGIPVLVPDNPMNASEVEALSLGVNALKFTAGDPNALAAAVSEWFAVAEEIDSRDYISAREHGLQTWGPESVAKRIVEAVTQ